MDFEYRQFLNQKVLDYLPSQKWSIGNKWNFKCPLCGDGSHNKRRGFWYNETATFYCFNCGTSMSGIKFLQFVSGQDYTEIRKEYVKLYLKSGMDSSLSAYCETPKEEPGIFDLKQAVKPEWKKPLSDKAKSYLDGRLVTSAPFLKEDLYSCYSKNGDEYIMIPWVVNGIEAYYQLNDFQKLHDLKYVFPKNSRKILYGLDNVDVTWPYIIVFEGVYDSLFVKNAVASGTKSLTEYQIKLIAERYPNHTICLSFDCDVPGVAATRKFIEKSTDFKFFRWYDADTKQKDVNDYIKATGDVMVFSDRKKLENMIFGPLQTKFWLMENGLWLKEKKLEIDIGRKSRRMKKCVRISPEEARAMLSTS